MNINKYTKELESLIHSCPFVVNYILNIDVRSAEFAFISGKINFRDNSILDFKEFIEISEQRVVKIKYGYNYRKNSKLIFRYDNALDPRAKDLNSFPHHKHLENGKIVETQETNLAKILQEIEKFILTHS